jgi:D-psicose/D-tagatose/L-ribulose 3-epimerase
LPTGPSSTGAIVGVSEVARPVGIEIFYWMDRWSDDQAAYFHRARQAGFDGVEISLVAGAEPPVERIRGELEANGLGVVCSTGLSPALDVSSPDRAIRKAGIAHLLQSLETAAAVGSPVLGGVTYAPWFHFPAESDLQPYRERSAAALVEVARAAASLGVDLCVEVLNRFESFMFNTAEEALGFLALVDHPSVRVELDTFHMNIEEDDFGGAIRSVGDLLGHFQVAANNRRPPQYGHFDWSAIRAALDDIDYRGWVVFETFPNPSVETGRSTHAWRSLVDDPDAEARAAAAFLREQLA